MYIKEVEKANQTLRETLRSKESVITSQFIEEILSQSNRIESRPIYNYNDQDSRQDQR